VKDAAGTSVDPSLKPWLSNLAGAILGAAAVATAPANLVGKLARPQLEGLGLLNSRAISPPATRPRRAALFQATLVDQMDEFKANHNGQNPQQSDVQKMINRLLLPIVISTPNHGIRSLRDTQTPGYLFEANSRADDASYDITVQYEDIPRDLRMAIEADLTKPGKPRPTRKQIEDEYELFVLNR
jgi:hypothetical protein